MCLSGGPVLALRGFCIFFPIAIDSAGVTGAAFSRRPEKCGGQIHIEKRRARRNTHTRGRKLAKSRPPNEMRGNGLNCPFCLSYFRAFRVAIISSRVSQYGLPLWVATMGQIFFCISGCQYFGRGNVLPNTPLLRRKKEDAKYDRTKSKLVFVFVYPGLKKFRLF